MTVEPDPLTAFLQARIEEDAHVARAVVSACRDVRHEWPPEQAPGRGGPALTEFLRHFSESRMLREVEAKRAILAEHPLTRHVIPPGYRLVGEGFGCELCHDWDGVTEGRGYCGTLLAAVAVYSGHPDYRQEWKP